MKNVTSFDEDTDAINIGSQEPLDLQHALAALGESWINGAAENFAVSFVSPINALYSNLLAVWPKEATPEESLVLLSRDIEVHLRRYAQENKIKYFGLSLATNGNEPSSIPYSWLYDLRRGSKIMLMLRDVPSLAQGIWLGYTPLEESEIEKYRELEREQQKQAVSDQALDRLDLWQRQFVHMLNTALADMAQNGFTAMSGIFRTISSLLRQGQSLAKAIAQGRGQTIERRLESAEIKTETDNMRQAILNQLADTSLPETIRAALRQQLKSLNEATKDQTAPLNAVRAVAKTGLVTKGDNIVSFSAFAAAFKALSTDRRPAESRLLSTPAALAMRGSVTAINTNVETVREILALLSSKDQPKDVRELIAALTESGQPLTVSKIISALAEKGHAAAISNVMIALSDKGQMAGVRMIALALAETRQQAVINAVVTTLAGNNQQFAAQTLAVIAENKPQVAAQAITVLAEANPPTIVQSVMNSLAEANPQAAIQMAAALAEAKQSPAVNAVIAALAESNPQVTAASALPATSQPSILNSGRLSENNHQVEVQTIALLTQNNPQITTQTITALIETQPAATIQAVISTLAETAKPAVVNATVVALLDRNPQLATQVIATLTESNQQAAVQVVKGLIETQPPQTVQIVIAALTNANQPAAITTVITALTKSDPQTAVQTIAALVQSGQTELLNKVVAGLTDNNQQTAAQAVVSLMANNNPQTVAQAVAAFTENKVATNWQSAVADKIKDIGTVVGNTGAHVTETFREAATSVTAFAAHSVQIGQTVITEAAQKLGSALQATSSTLSNGFQTAANLVTSFMGPDCALCKLFGKTNAKVEAAKPTGPL